MKKEKILSQIKLRHFCKGEDGKGPTDSNLVCCVCDTKDIAIGSVLDAYSDNPKFVCEDCAIDNYQKAYKFRDREAATARRRRIFDVSYLFSEMIIDKYLSDKNLKTVDDLSDDGMSKIMEIGRMAYDDSFSKTDKIKLEEIELQSEIEEKLRKKLKFVKI